jgi:hypothetical protein
MKINKIYLYRLHNEEHFQFGADVIALIRDTEPDSLKIDAAYAAFTEIHAEEDEVLEQIRKSALTGKIEEAYCSLVEQLDALAVVASLQVAGSTVGDAAVFNAFIASLNTLIERYNNTLAVRKGRAKAGADVPPAPAAPSAE